MLSWRYGGRRQPRGGPLPLLERASDRCSFARAALVENIRVLCERGLGVGGSSTERLGTPYEGWNLDVSVFIVFNMNQI